MWPCKHGLFSSLPAWLMWGQHTDIFSPSGPWWPCLVALLVDPGLTCLEVGLQVRGVSHSSLGLVLFLYARFWDEVWLQENQSLLKERGNG